MYRDVLYAEKRREQVFGDVQGCTVCRKFMDGKFPTMCRDVWYVGNLWMVNFRRCTWTYGMSEIHGWKISDDVHGCRSGV
jgi:hypothetical protein